MSKVRRLPTAAAAAGGETPAARWVALATRSYGELKDCEVGELQRSCRRIENALGDLEGALSAETPEELLGHYGFFHESMTEFLMVLHRHAGREDSLVPELRPRLWGCLNELTRALCLSGLQPGQFRSIMAERVPDLLRAEMPLLLVNETPRAVMTAEVNHREGDFFGIDVRIDHELAATVEYSVTDDKFKVLSFDGLHDDPAREQVFAAAPPAGEGFDVKAVAGALYSQARLSKERRARAEAALQAWEFETTVEEMGGWECDAPGDRWARRVYLAREERCTLPVTFTVEFEPGRARVIAQGVQG